MTLGCALQYLCFVRMINLLKSLATCSVELQCPAIGQLFLMSCRILIEVFILSFWSFTVMTHVHLIALSCIV